MAEQKDDGYVRFHCRYCGKRLKVRKGQGGGDVISCPRCGEPVNVPVTNLDDIAGAEELLDGGGQGEQLDPAQLLRQLKEEEDQMGEKQKQKQEEQTADTREEPRKWRPQRTMGRVDELDHLRNRLNQLEEDAVEDFQRLLQTTGMSREDKLKEIETIAAERRETIREHCRDRLEDLQEKRRKLKESQRTLDARGKQRLRQLDRTIQAVKLYLGRILGMKR